MLALAGIAALVGLSVITAPSVGSDQLGGEPIAAVRFDFHRHEVLVDSYIDGFGPYSVLLDTGAAPSVVDLKLAREIGLKTIGAGSQGSGGGTGRSLMFETTLPTVLVGGLIATKVAALATDLSGLGKEFGRPIAAVLGDSLFSGRVVQFDFPSRVVRFFEHSPIVKSSDTRFHGANLSIPFSHAGSEVRFRGLRINGKPVLANLDTGSSGGFELTPRGTKLLRLTRAAARSLKSHAAGFNGGYENRTGRLRLVELGAIRVVSPPVDFWLPNTGHDDRPWDVNVGNLFLQGFVVTIDYSRNTLTFSSPKR